MWECKEKCSNLLRCKRWYQTLSWEYGTVRVFFSLVLAYPATGYMLREVKSHSWVCCWILVVFIFACYHVDKSQQPIIHFVFRR